VVPEIEEKGLKFVGQDETGERQEIVEIPAHPYYVG
jgi:CTP synthase